MQKFSLRREIAFGFAGLALALHFATWIASLAYTSVAISTLLVTTSPLWTETFDAIRDRRAPSKAFCIALVLGFLGVALVASQRGGGKPPVPGHELLGDALALAGSVAIGAYLLVVRDAALQPGGARVPTRQLVVRTYGWAAVALLAAAAFARQGPPPLHDATAWGGVVAMALISQLLGHTALNASLATFTPSVVGLSTLCEPIVAALLAAIFFHEGVGVQTVAGGVLVLASVGIVLRDPRALA